MTKTLIALALCVTALPALAAPTSTEKAKLAALVAFGKSQCTTPVPDKFIDKVVEFRDNGGWTDATLRREIDNMADAATKFGIGPMCRELAKVWKHWEE